MNFYEHHLGDYLRDTAHLTMLEDAAYRRLLDVYYVREKPLPLDLPQCCKLARAQTIAEREAVVGVLEEFFAKTEEGYRQARADAEIARFQEKQRKAKASANARWSQSERIAPAPQPHPAPALPTHSEGNALQSPVPSPQSPVSKQESRGDPPRAARSTATRLPDGFELTPELEKIASTEGLAPQRTFEKFCDYWHSASGANARKHDWKATWRNWCRTEADRLRNYGGGRVTGLTRAAKSADELEREAARASG